MQGPLVEKNKGKYRILRRIGRVLLGLLLVFIAAILFIRSPWGQDIIVNRLVRSIAEKTDTKIEIDRLFITFSGNIYLEGLYMEDKSGDTLIYSRALEANIPLYGAVFNNQITISSLTWEGVRVRISRKENTEKYNFSFLTEALVSGDTTTTTSQPYDIRIEDVELQDFMLGFNDAHLGVQTTIDLGRFSFAATEFDLNDMRFRVGEMHITDTEVNFDQTKPIPVNDTASVRLPYVALDKLSILNFRGRYNSVPDSLLATIGIGDFKLEVPQADLPGKSIDITQLSLKDSEIFIQTPLEATSSGGNSQAGKPTVFSWPEYTITARDIDLNDTGFRYVTGKVSGNRTGVNPNDLDLRDISLQIGSAAYQPENVSLHLDSLSFGEPGGFRLDNMAFDLVLDDSKTSVSGLSVNTSNSTVSGRMDLQYASFRDLLEKPGKSTVELNFPDFAIDLKDLLYFQPKLAGNEYVEKAITNKFSGHIMAAGTLERMELPQVQIEWGTNTSLSAKGELRHITQPDSLSFDLNAIRAQTTREDLLNFVSEEKTGMSLPKTVDISAAIMGTPAAFSGEAHIDIPEGSAKIVAGYNGREKKYNGNISLDSLQLGILTKNSQLGKLSGNLEFAGGGTTLNDLDLQFSSAISQLGFRDYIFTGLVVDGSIDHGKGEIGLRYKDSNLNMDARANVVLDSVDSKIDLDMKLSGADLQALGITSEDIRTGFHIKANFNGNQDNFGLKALLSDAVAVYDGNQYQLGEVDLSSNITPTNTEVGVKSDFLTADLSSNTSPEGLIAALKQQFRNYFHDGAPGLAVSDSVKFHMDAVLRPKPALTDVFFRKIENLDSVTVVADYDEVTGNMAMEMHLPAVNYAGIAIDSLNIIAKGTKEDLSFTAGLSNMTADPVAVKKTIFKGTLRNKILELDFEAMNDADRLMHLAADMVITKDTISLHLNPRDFILNQREWNVPDNNLLRIADKHLGFRDMVLSRANQQLELSNTMADVQAAHIGITFTDFRLQTFLSLLNPEEALAAGQVNGEFVIENPYGATGLLADFTIDSLKLLQKPLGKLTLNASSKSKGDYDFNLTLRDPGVDIDLTGEYAAADTGAALNLELGINKLDMQRVEAFSMGSIRESNGIISGKIAVSGTTAKPQYTGKLEFDQIDFKVAMLNSRFKLSEEYLDIDTRGIYFDNFEIEDANDKKMHIDGSVFTEQLFNPGFDLKVVANEFLLLNSTEKDNELFYGIASIDTDVKVGGTLQAPVVEGKLKIRKVTDVTYVVPESQLDVQERDGVVIFVNRQEPDAILTATEETEAPQVFQDTRIKAFIEIADDSDFHIILDKRSGDNLQISGSAELNLDVEPNNRVSLSGRYELDSGHYETSLYNLVKRRFEINPGSSISWQGDPTDARLDITATYSLETSVAPLMSAVTSGQDASITGKYRQVLPFLVYLKVNGRLLQPELSFALDMPENVQGTFGGTVYTRVQQLNSQEAELNKQVFSLLALNRFFPDSGSDGSSGGTAALARDNVNKVLSGELNAFSDRIFGNTGFELDFNLDSFTDYQGETPQDRTQLNINASKKLFDDRLIVTAGSAVDVEGSAQTTQDPTPLIGNVSLEYLLTENGRYRLKGFRKNEFQNIIDGQLIVTGVALIFNREFNRMSELFNPMKEGEASTKKEEKPAETEQQDE